MPQRRVRWYLLTYVGSFHLGKRTGLGRLTGYLDASNTQISYVYEGRFDNNLPHGKGRLSLPTRKPVEGIWEKGLFKVVL